MSPHSSDIRTNKLVLTALMVCLVLLGTILFRIPVPMTQGYVHLGDAMVYTGVLLLGKKQGAVAAALGSSLADVLGGFAFWAPWSFFIKIVSMTAGGIIMCTGYLIAERVMYGSWAIAAIGLPWNAGQFAVGIAVALAMQPLFRLIRSGN